MEILLINLDLISNEMNHSISKMQGLAFGEEDDPYEWAGSQWACIAQENNQVVSYVGITVRKIKVGNAQ